MANNTANEAKGFYKLSWLQRIGFGAGDMAQNLIYQTVSIWLLFFYTNVYGLSPGAAALMFLIVRLVDVLWDPIVGAFVDKGNPKWGKYRSWLILGGIPLAGLAILCFWNQFSGSLVYAYITYVGMSMCYTLVNVPYGALNSSLMRVHRSHLRRKAVSWDYSRKRRRLRLNPQLLQNSTPSIVISSGNSPSRVGNYPKRQIVWHSVISTSTNV